MRRGLAREIKQQGYVEIGYANEAPFSYKDPSGQWEAGIALNFTRAELYRWGVLPQAIPPMIPAIGIGIALGFAGVATMVGFGEMALGAGIALALADALCDAGKDLVTRRPAAFDTTLATVLVTWA